MRFREEPIGEVRLKHGGGQILKQKRTPGIKAKDTPKMAFSADPVRKFGGRGHWFELRVDEFSGGEVCLMALGFTSTDPEKLQEKLQEEEGALPGRAHMVPGSYLVGYMHSAFWDGERIQADGVFDKIIPYRGFFIGVLATPAGSLELYINRRLALSIDPTDRGLPPITTEEPLWAVVDTCGGLRKATCLPSSLPPTEEEDVPEGEGGG